MKQYSVTAMTVLAVLACTHGYAQTNTMPLPEVSSQNKEISYVAPSITGGVQASTDTKLTPVLQIKPAKKGETVMPVEASSQPVRIDADKMYYNGTTGKVWAKGTVEVERGTQQLLTPKVEGNVQTQRYESKEGYHFLEEKGLKKDLQGAFISYNASNGQAQTKDVFGYADPYWVKAKAAEFDGTHGHIEKGWITTKHAIAFKGAPDYRVEGDSIDIYPGDKAIIHNAALYIKNTKILSVKRYKVSLRKDKKGQLNIFSIIPRPSYNSTDGFVLRGNIEYPLSNTSDVFLGYTLGSKVGFKPSFGYEKALPWGEVSLAYTRESSTLNAEKVWVEKKPELSIDTHAYHIGHSPLTIRGGLSMGRWYEGDIKGSHHKIYGEVSHDPWLVLPSTDVTAFVGYQRDYYGYNGLTRTMPYWGIGAKTTINDRVKAWAGYHQNNTSETLDSPYSFDKVDVKHDFYYGVSVQATKLDRFSINVQQDLLTHQLRYVDISWHRDLHSFEGSLTYRTKQKKWEYTLVAKDF